MANNESPDYTPEAHQEGQKTTRRRKLFMVLVPLIILIIAVIILLIYYLRRPREPEVKANVVADVNSSLSEPLNDDGVLFNNAGEVISKLEGYTIRDELQAHFERDFMPPYDIALIKSASFRPRLGLMLLMECAMNESYVKNDPLLPSVADIVREHMPIRTYVPGSTSGNMPWGIPGVSYRAGSIQETASEIRTRSDDRESNAISHFSHYFDQARMMHGISVQPPPPIGIRMYPSYALQFWDPSTFDCQEYADWLYHRFDQSELYETISRDLWKILKFRRGRENSENEFASLNFDSWHEFLLLDPHQRFLCEELSQVYFEDCTEADAKFRDHFKMFLVRPRSAVWFMLTRWSFHLVSCRIMAKTMVTYRLIPEDFFLRSMAECDKDNSRDIMSCLNNLSVQVKQFWGDSIDSPISVFAKNRLRWQSEQYHFLSSRRMWSISPSSDFFFYTWQRSEENGELAINIPLAKYLLDLVHSSQIESPPPDMLNLNLVDTASVSNRMFALNLSALYYKIVSTDPTNMLTELDYFAHCSEININLEYARSAIQQYNSYLLFAALSIHNPDRNPWMMQDLSQAAFTTFAFPLPLIHECHQTLDLADVKQALGYLTSDVDQLDPSSSPDFISQTFIHSQCYQDALQMLLESDRPPEDLIVASESQRLIICYLLSLIVAFDKLKSLKELLPDDFVIYTLNEDGWPELAPLPPNLPDPTRVQQLLAGHNTSGDSRSMTALMIAQKAIEILRMNSDDQQQVFQLLDWYQKAWTEHLGVITVKLS